MLGGGSNDPLTIDIAATVGSVTVASAYSGTITEQADLVITGGFALSGGTWVAGSHALTIGGAVSIDPIATLFDAGSGTVTLNGSSTLSNPLNPFATLVIASGQVTTLISDTIVTQQCVVAGQLVFTNWHALHLRGSGQLLSVTGSLNAISPNRGIIEYESTTSAPIAVMGGSYGWCQLIFHSLDGVQGIYQQQGPITAIDSFITTADSADASVEWDTNGYNLASSSFLALGDYGASAGGTTVHAGASQISAPALCWVTTGEDALYLEQSAWTVGEWAVWNDGVTVDPGTSTVTVNNGIGPFWTVVPHDFYNLNINGACPLYGPITVGHDLTVVAGGILTTSNLAVSVSHDLIVQPGGSLAAGSSSITVGSDLTIANQDGAFQAGTSQVTLTGPGTLTDPDQTNAFYQLSLAGPGATVLLGSDLTTINLLTVLAGTVDFHDGVGAILHLQGTGQVFSNQGSLWAGFPDGGSVRYESRSSTMPMSVEGGNYGWASLQLVSLGGAEAAFSQTGDIGEIDDCLTTADTAGGNVQWTTNDHALSVSSWMSLGDFGASQGGTTLLCGSSQIGVPAFAWFTNAADVVDLQNSTWSVGGWGAWDSSAQINPGSSTIITSGDLGVFWTSLPQPFWNLVVNAPSSDVTAYGTLVVGGTLSIENGTLLANGNTISVAGDVGVNPSAGLVADASLDLVGSGSQTLAASAGTSIDLLSVAGGARTVSLPNGVLTDSLQVDPGPTLVVGEGATVQTMALDLQGTATQPITLESSTSGESWNLSIPASGTAALTDVLLEGATVSTPGQQLIDNLGSDLGGNTDVAFNSVVSSVSIQQVAATETTAYGVFNLSVAATDSSNAVPLSYSWSCSPANGTFSANNSTTASSSQVTLTPGSYTLTVLVTDTRGSSASGQTSLSVPITYNYAAVTPASVVLNRGDTQVFGITQYLTDGTTTPVAQPETFGSISWTFSSRVSPGTMVDNLFTAGGTPGTYSLLDTNGFTQEEGPPRAATIRINAAPAITSQPTAVLGQTMTSATLTVGATDDGGPANLTYTWQQPTTQSSLIVMIGTSDPTTSVTFSQAGTYTYWVTVTDVQGLSVTSSPVSVVVPSIPNSLQISPTTATLATGSTQAFVVTGFDQFRQESTPVVNWASAPSGVGAFSGDVLTAGSTAGTYTITASSGAIVSNPAMITVIPSPPTFTLSSSQLSVVANEGPQTVTGFAIVSSPASTTVTYQVTTSASSLFTTTPSISSAGTLTYQPNLSASGTATVSVIGYSAGNPQPSASQSFTIVITAVGALAPPVFSLQQGLTLQETGSPTLQQFPGFVSLQSPSSGQVSYVVTATLSSNSTDPVIFTVPAAIDGSGTLSFQLEPYQYGTIAFNVQGFSAGNPIGSAVVTSTVAVTYINQPPTIYSSESTLSCSPNEDVSQGLSVSVGPQSEQWQTLTFLVSDDNPNLFSVPPSVGADGTLNFTIGDDYGYASVTITAEDSGGTANGGHNQSSPSVTLAIDVTPPLASVWKSEWATDFKWGIAGTSVWVSVTGAYAEDYNNQTVSIPLDQCRIGTGDVPGSTLTANGYGSEPLPPLQYYEMGETAEATVLPPNSYAEFSGGEFFLPFLAQTATLPPGPNTPEGTCLTCHTKGAAHDAAAPASPEAVTGTPLNDTIDNVKGDFSTEVDDYVPATSAQGTCQSCNAAPTPTNALPTLQFKRIMRYQNPGMQSSYGPSVYSNYDLSLGSITSLGATLWDPECAYPITFTPTLTAGIYADTVYSAYQSLTFADETGAPPATMTSAVSAVALANDGTSYHFEIIPFPAQQAARLTSIVNRNGAAVTITYQNAVSTIEAQASPDYTVLWKIASITDAYGRTATVTYATTKIFGSWAIQSISLPNQGTITYQYANATLGLSSVQWSTGSASTFSAASNSIVIDDAAATGSQRHQTVAFEGFSAPSSGGSDTPWFQNLVTSVTNGAGEIAYENFSQLGEVESVNADNENIACTYNGGNSFTQFTTSQEGLPLETDQASSASLTESPSSFEWYPVETYVADRYHSVSAITNGVGNETSYVLNGEEAPTATTYADGSSDSATYNSFKEPLHVVDRTGRVTDFTYDVNGNLLSKTQATGSTTPSTWTWTYNAFGQVTTATDANANVTMFVYNANHYLVTRIDPPDVTGGADSVSSYTYDTAGRLATSTDASGRTTSFGYDQQDRLILVTYADNSTEVTTYGTGELSNLVVSTTDRNGHITTFGYDAAGRKISQTMAAGLPESVTDTWTYLTGTDLVATYTHDSTSLTTNGNVTTYTYDYRNRLIATTVSPTTTISLTTQSSYDADDRLVSTSDPYGRNTYSEYDVNDRVIRTATELAPGALGANPVLANLTRVLTANAPFLLTDTSYDAEGRTLTTTDPRGIVTANTYDAQARLSTQVQASGTSVAAQTSWTYDAQGNVVTETLPRTIAAPDAYGYQTTSTWTGRNLLETRTEAAGRPEQAIATYTYSPTGKVASQTDPNGHTTTTTYEPCCDRVYQVIDPLGGTTTYGYDPVGNITSMTDPNGNVTAKTYDGLNRIATMTDGAGDLTSYRYDDNLTDGVGIDATLGSRLSDLHLGANAAGSAVSVTDPTHGVTTTIIDGTGRTIRVFDPNGNATTITYDALVTSAPGAPGTLVSTVQTDPLGHQQTQDADGAGRVLASVDALGNVTQLGVDADGNQVSVLDPNAVGMTCVFDSRNRRTQCTSTQGDTTAWTYDADGNVLTTTDGQGAITIATFDGRDRRVTLTDRVSAKTSYTYDGVNHVLTIIDAEGGVTAYTYDQRNLLVQESFPGSAGGIRTYGYDAGWRLHQRTDQTGSQTIYGYDGANRLTSRSYPDGRNDAFTYDGSGRLLTAQSQRYQNTVIRSYDVAGRLMDEGLSVLGSPGLATTVRYDVFHGYDNANREILTSYPDGTQVSHSFTARNQLASIVYGGSTVASRVYDLDGRLLTTTTGNGLVETRSYRLDNTVASLGVPAITGFAYTYDHDQRKLTEANTITAAASQTYTYDGEGRVLSWNLGATAPAVQTWTLAPVGDWLTTTKAGVTQTDAHNTVHELIAINSQPLNYDAKGNLTADTQGNALTWDVENRLSQATGLGNASWYGYDALGRRVRKTVNGVTTTYVSAGNQEVYEVDTNQRVYYANGANGGPGTATLPEGGIINGATVTRIDFQTASATTPTGYAPDTGEAFGVQADGLSYGWSGSGQPDTYEYTSEPLQQYNGNDNIQASGQSAGTWTLNLPNGTYPVAVVMGDAGRRDMTNNITVGGVTCTDPSPDTVGEAQGYEAGRFVGYAVNVTVSNGSLSVTAGAGAVNPRICFIEVGASGTSIDSATQTRLSNLTSAMTSATAGTPPKLATRAFVYGSYVDEPLLYVNNGAKYYIHSNDLYSVAALTDQTGALVEQYTYDAYGRQTVEGPDGTVRTASSYAMPWGFTGRRNDPETGLMYFRARMYSPGLGRFVGRDPKGYVDGMDFYLGYLIPNFVDPSGEEDTGGQVPVIHIPIDDPGDSPVTPKPAQVPIPNEQLYLDPVTHQPNNDTAFVYRPIDPNTNCGPGKTLAAVSNPPNGDPASQTTKMTWTYDPKDETHDQAYYQNNIGNVSDVASVEALDALLNGASPIQRLSISGHGGITNIDPTTKLPLGEIELGLGQNGGSGMSANELAAHNISAGNIEKLFKRDRFCKKCEIWLLSCYLGYSTLPQAIANTSGCIVYAYRSAVSSIGGAMQVPWLAPEYKP